MNYSFMTLPEISVVPGTLDKSADYSASLLIYHDLKAIASVSSVANFQSIANAAAADASFDKSINVLCPAGSSTPVVTSCVGKLDRDYDDVRRYADAVAKAIKRAKAAKWARPLLVLQPPPTHLSTEYGQYVEVSLLAALAESYEMLQARENSGKDPLHVFDTIGICVIGKEPADTLDFIRAIEGGRRLARDIGGADPERMTALRTAETIQAYFADKTNVTVSVMRDRAELQQNYPLLMAVARGSEPVARHAPCVITLTYRSPDQSAVTEELFLVGKGVTFDTGGMDVKISGHMVGMSRDKCGAAAVAGFMAAVAALSPRHLNVVCKLAMVRNSIGSNGYVADEILVSRAGTRIRVGNTDAEGRMAMADVLAEAKEMALKIAAPQKARILTCATLTGHAALSVGQYPIAMDNGPARRLGMAPSLFSAGHMMGDPFEVSQIRRDDFKAIEPKNNAYDCEQILHSSFRCRGHQYPSAFLQMASGLDRHGIDSEVPLAYTHLDIAGVMEDGETLRPLGIPIVALATRFIRRLAIA